MDQSVPRPAPRESRRRPDHPPSAHHRHRHRVLALPPRPRTPHQQRRLTPTRKARPRPSPLRRRPTGDGSVTTVAATPPTTRSGNIQTNNNRREVGPLQASTPGPLQVATPNLAAHRGNQAYRRRRDIPSVRRSGFGCPARSIRTAMIGPARVPKAHPDHRVLIGHLVCCVTRLVSVGFASTAAGRGPRCLPGRGPLQDLPLPAVVRCRERQQDVAPWRACL